MITLISDVQKEVEAKEESKAGAEDVISHETPPQTQKNIRVPLYQRLFYSKLYNSYNWSALLDKNWLLNLITFGMNKKLTQACCSEIEMHSKVLQLGGTFGNQLAELADSVGYYGRLDVVDINRTQLSRMEGKYETLYPQMHFIRGNAEDKIDEEYDTVVCYMLLHELPIASKTKVVENALHSIGDNGKVVFIDYSQPNYWHPLRYIVRMFNRLYQPFAEKLWDRSIDTFAKDNLDYIWHRTCYFGGMYQKVVAVKRPKMYEATSTVSKYL